MKKSFALSKIGIPNRKSKLFNLHNQIKQFLIITTNLFNIKSNLI